MKWIEIIVTDQYDNYPIVKYLKIIQPNWTKVFAMKMIRTGNVLINKGKTKINYRLRANDKIKYYGCSYEESPKEKFNFSRLRPLKTIYEDGQVIIVDKEVGIPVQSDEKSVFNNMNNRLLRHVKWDPKDQKDRWKPVFIHRLDRNTRGLLIGAKTYEAYVELVRAMKGGQIHKYYLTKTHGLVPFKVKLIHNYLLKIPSENKTVAVSKDTANAKEAISEVKLVKHLMDTKESLLEVNLITGRTHQIRAHLSGIGFPIRGDQKYGVEKDKKTYPYPDLTAYKLIFSDELTGKKISNLKGKTFTLGNR